MGHWWKEGNTRDRVMLFFVAKKTIVDMYGKKFKKNIEGNLGLEFVLILSYTN